MDLYPVGNDFGDVQRNALAADQFRQQAYQQSMQMAMQQQQMQMEKQKLAQQNAYQQSLMEYGYGGRQGALLQRAALDFQKEQAKSGDTGPAARLQQFRWNMAHQEALEGSFEKENYPEMPKELSSSFQTMSDNAYQSKSTQAADAENLAQLHNREQELNERQKALSAQAEEMHRTFLPNKTGTDAQGNALTYESVQKQIKDTGDELARVTKTLQYFHNNKTVEGMVGVGPTGKFIGITHVPYRTKPPRTAPMAGAGAGAGIGVGGGSHDEEADQNAPTTRTGTTGGGRSAPFSGTGTTGGETEQGIKVAPEEKVSSGPLSMVRMRDNKGNLFDIPSANVGKAKAKGWVEVNPRGFMQQLTQPDQGDATPEEQRINQMERMGNKYRF